MRGLSARVPSILSTVLARGAKLPRANVEDQMPMLVGWVQSHLRVKTESRYWLDGQAREDPGSGVLAEAFRKARAAKEEMPADLLLHIELAWP
ncbi:hypothetical protein LZ198_35730 [Myxococcus sp. K15C18031901]|uniref:hypothetical protein n=1 Tax=Myxococcus dinghuensis TaxID=2906761 RepID=UPI0020A7087F|nr:hypothetical protein [Myxococcus dinghuensis]MCP3104228.1 hypothetical protein [Myxococcus dinghuensis]